MMKSSRPRKPPATGPETPAHYRLPPPLAKGDKVALISPSSHQGEAGAQMIEEAAEVLSGWGLEVVNAGRPERRHLYLAGTDRERADEFQTLYCDPEVRGLFLTRGGYGSARMLPLLDRAAIAAAAPKPVAGFSDATALFAYLHAVAGISVVHGPCLAAPVFVRRPPLAEELEALRRALFEPEQDAVFPISLLNRPPDLGESVQGRLVGGCLSVLVTTIGTPWELDTRGAVLFLEEVNEEPYRIDRLVTHLRQAGKFRELRALVLGRLEGCEGGTPGLLREVLRDLFLGAPFPVAEGLPAGHGAPNMTLPLGRAALLKFPAPDSAPPEVDPAVEGGARGGLLRIL